MTTTTNRQELPASVRATIGDGAMAKVSRFFNGTVTDVLLELFQNARRAGASEVRVTTEADPDAAGTTRVLVSDNGQGIADPSTLLAFGDSGWNQETARAEDPAGMGLYSLAGRPGRCRIESSTAASGPWAVTLEAVHFTREKTADIEQGDRDTVGTEIRFDVRKRDHNEPVAKIIESAVETAARYQLIDVTLNGAVMKRKRITDKSIDTHVWGPRGNVRFGVKNGLPIWNDRIQLVVNGQPVENAKLPYVRVPDIRSLTPDAFQVVADIVDAPELPLVLPTRKDVVRTPFLTDELLPAAERALYRTLSRMPTDGRDETILAFTAGHRATVARLNRELPEAERITLPEPPRQLFPWNPTPSVTRSTGVTRPVPANPDQGPPVALVGPDSLEPLVAQALRAATERDGGKTPLLWADYAGFDDLDWHRALPRVTRVDVEVAFADATVAWNAAKPAPPAFVDRDDRRPERITFTVHSRSDDPDGIREHEPVKLDADWIAVSEDTSEDWMRARFTDEAALFIRKGAALRKDKLVEALTEAIGDDEDEQHRWYVYQEEWEAEIDRITLGDDEAKLVLMKRITREHLLPLTPTNTRTTIVIERGKGIDVTVTPTGDQAAV